MLAFIHREWYTIAIFNRWELSKIVWYTVFEPIGSALIDTQDYHFNVWKLWPVQLKIKNTSELTQFLGMRINDLKLKIMQLLHKDTQKLRTRHVRNKIPERIKESIWKDRQGGLQNPLNLNSDALPQGLLMSYMED